MDHQAALRIVEEVQKAVIGKETCVFRVMAAVLAKGHVLIEDIPGVGKTTMAMAFSKAMGLSGHRMQFTPDVMPSDITGFSLYRQESGQFEYQPGAIMCNVFLADEINRTSPKTQSALLECMEEGHVTVDGVTHAIPSPFLVIATQNPFGSAGTQLLPESQIDRFMVCVEMGYPTLEDEIRIVKGRERGSLVETVQVVSSAEEILRMQDETEQIHLEESMYRYISEIVRATRDNPLVQLGISPRGSIALTRMTKAVAYLRGRDYGIPADVQEIVSDTLSHRLRLSARAKAEELSVQTVMERIAGSVTAPSLRTRV